MSLDPRCYLLERDTEAFLSVQTSFQLFDIGDVTFQNALSTRFVAAEDLVFRIDGTLTLDLAHDLVVMDELDIDGRVEEGGVKVYWRSKITLHLARIWTRFWTLLLTYSDHIFVKDAT
jgi:hypothetical protein